jgi:rhodanese-related sulfurtransferase
MQSHSSVQAQHMKIRATGGSEVGADESVQVEDLPVEEVWTRLRSDPNSVLIDVRTREEWAFVGLPDLAGIGKRVMTVEWQTFPDNRVDPAFVERLGGLLDAAGVGRDSELLFICRSGGRSRMAAEAMVAAGFTRCRNVAEGFEGPLDERRHRGGLAGWKAAGLPWVQG